MKDDTHSIFHPQRKSIYFYFKMSQKCYNISINKHMAEVFFELFKNLTTVWNMSEKLKRKTAAQSRN